MKAPLRPVALSLAVLVGATLAPLSQEGFQGEIEQSRSAARSLSGALMGALAKAMAEGGPKSAVSVCRDAAPAIARRVSEETGLRVGRTSRRVRNPANAPDDWERGALEALEARAQKGEDVASLEVHGVVEEGGRRVFRYMKAIPTGDLCLTCHGPDVDARLLETIRKNYPGDAATGFRKGDLRGAVTIRKDLGPSGPRQPE